MGRFQNQYEATQFTANRLLHLSEVRSKKAKQQTPSNCPTTQSSQRVCHTRDLVVSQQATALNLFTASCPVPDTNVADLQPPPKQTRLRVFLLPDLRIEAGLRKLQQPGDMTRVLLSGGAARQ